MLRTLSIIAAIVLLSAGCGPARESSAEQAGPVRVQDKGAPEITAQGISKDVVGQVVEVSEVHGSLPSTEWTFEADEYRRIDILDRRPTATGIDLLVFMLTRNDPKPNEDDVQVSGQLRLSYEWKGSKWVLRKIENVSFRYSVGVAT